MRVKSYCDLIFDHHKMCDICAEPFNKSTRKKFESNCCELNVCRTCVGTYLMGSSEEDKCMQCNTAYRLETLEEGFTKKFLGELQLRKSELFLETQRALLPDTQDLAARTREARELQATAVTLKEREVELALELRRIKSERLRAEDRARLLLDYNRPRPEEEGIPPELRVKEEKGRAFIKPCSRDGCHGFLSQAYKCGMCEFYTCSKCHMPKDEDHECNPDDVASVNAIKSDSKPCPKCGVMIFKYAGCSQCFCESCKTVFDFNSGRIQIGGFIHAPGALNYFAQQRRLNAEQNPDINPCREIAPYEVRQEFNRKTLRYRQQIQEIYNRLYELSYFIPDFEGRALNQFRADHDSQYRHMRIHYMLGDLNEDEWKKKIHALRKKEYKGNKYMQVLGMVPDVLKGFLREQYYNMYHGREVSFNELDEFQRIVNIELRKLNNNFKVKGILLDV